MTDSWALACRGHEGEADQAVQEGQHSPQVQGQHQVWEVRSKCEPLVVWGCEERPTLRRLFLLP
jgi:hypothetical protein